MAANASVQLGHVYTQPLAIGDTLYVNTWAAFNISVDPTSTTITFTRIC